MDKKRAREQMPLKDQVNRKPQTKEDAIRDLMQKDPERAAKLLREILKGK